MAYWHWHVKPIKGSKDPRHDPDLREHLRYACYMANVDTLEEDIRECVRLGQHIVARPRMDREAKRCDLIAEYNRVSDAAVRGPGFTSHTEKRLRLLRAKIEKLGGFKV